MPTWEIIQTFYNADDAEKSIEKLLNNNSMSTHFHADATYERVTIDKDRVFHPFGLVTKFEWDKFFVPKFTMPLIILD
ncbi:hypothetical protein BpHYR1_011678 [Brachionus plicatilis]|uniref:Uncharacterized protein n=1 Tax=Brachionus plicatilis TaxID=10195 RepID=A0A3M7PGG7_BRAPC|nr:hypothetical protein BpHYR1_011678 [Brachionus plicatilis]